MEFARPFVSETNLICFQYASALGSGTANDSPTKRTGSFANVIHKNKKPPEFYAEATDGSDQNGTKTQFIGQSLTSSSIIKYPFLKKRILMLKGVEFSYIFDLVIHENEGLF